MGAGLGSGRILPLNDIVDELTLIPHIPHEALKKMEKDWRDGTKDYGLSTGAWTVAQIGYQLVRCVALN